MRRTALAFVMVIASSIFAATAFAAPQAQASRPVIAQPAQDAVVRGVVQVVGTATHPQFQRYELFYAPWPVPSDNAWIFIGPDAHFQQQPLGLLGTWDSRAVPDGDYALRVRLVKKDGNYDDSESRRVTVANSKAPDTPTPVASETPSGFVTATPALTIAPTATIVVAMPMSGTVAARTVTPTAGATPTPRLTPILSGGDTGSAGGIAIGSIIDTAKIRAAAEQSAKYTLGAFAALGLFFGVKAMLVWLWHKMRP